MEIIVDYSKGLVRRHSDLLGNVVFHSEAIRLPFRDNHFDKCFVFSVFQYFPHKQYAHEVVAELKRVTKGTVLIGDIPIKSHDASHLLYTESDFQGEVIKGVITRPDRFWIMVQ